jgi:hypothetical protein
MLRSYRTLHPPQKYRINFLDVTQGSLFYQCVYLLVAKVREGQGRAARRGPREAVSPR